MYCANCGTQTDMLAICAHCFLDPRVPEMIIDRNPEELGCGRCRSLTAADTVASAIEYPGERTSLALSISVLAFLTVLIGTMTFGVFLLLVGVAILFVPVQEARVKSTLIRASKGHYDHLVCLAKVAAFRLNVPLPEIYIEQQIEPNAYTSGFWRCHWIVLHSCLLDSCTPIELLFVIGHEMGHIKRQHTSWLTLTSTRPVFNVPLVRNIITVIFNTWLLRAEYSADRAGLVACRSVEAAISALIRIQYWDKPADMDRLRAHWKSIDADPIIRMSELFQDHPHLHHRVEKLGQFDATLHKRAIL
jgi:Zn-dependent protease with chaperone function